MKVFVGLAILCLSSVLCEEPKSNENMIAAEIA
jgi:hypothetical protein